MNGRLHPCFLTVVHLDLPTLLYMWLCSRRWQSALNDSSSFYLVGLGVLMFLFLLALKYKVLYPPCGFPMPCPQVCKQSICKSLSHSQCTFSCLIVTHQPSPCPRAIAPRNGCVSWKRKSTLNSEYHCVLYLYICSFLGAQLSFLEVGMTYLSCHASMV